VSDQDQSKAGAPAFEEPDFSRLGGAADAAADFDDAEDDDVEENVLEAQEARGSSGSDDDSDDGDDGAELDAEDVNQSAFDANAVDGGKARAVLLHVASSIVDYKESVVIETEERRNGIKLSLHVAQGDMGRIIGRRGRTAQAVRTLVRAAGASEDREVTVDIVD
jgi:hypothetical protein